MKVKANIYDYKTLSEWYQANRNHYPVQIPAAIQRLMKAKNITFHEAYELLVEKRAIIEINQDK